MIERVTVEDANLTAHMPSGASVVISTHWTTDQGVADEPEENVIEAMLTADGDQTILVWEERGMRLDLLWAYGAGVQIHVEDLADHLAGHERRDDDKRRWAELHLPYQDLAASLG